MSSARHCIAFRGMDLISIYSELQMLRFICQLTLGANTNPYSVRRVSLSSVDILIL